MQQIMLRGAMCGLVMMLTGSGAVHAQSDTGGSSVRPLVRSSTPDRGPADATPGATPGAGGGDVTPQDRAFLQTHGRRIAEQFANIDGKLYACPGYDRRYASSARLSADRWRLDNAESQRVAAFTGLVKTKRYFPPREEVDLATMALPDLAPGAYGHIHSAKVVSVISPTQMLVTDVWLVDADQVTAERERDEKMGERIIERMKQDEEAEREREREQEYRRRGGYDREDCAAGDTDIRSVLEWRYRQRDQAIEKQKDFSGKTVRLVGFPTATAAPGRRWPLGAAKVGPQIAIIAEEMPPASKSGSSRSAKPVLVAINAQALDKPANDAHLSQLIAATAMSAGEFVALTQGMMREHGAEAMPLIVATLQNKLTQRAKPQAQPQSPGSPDAGAKAPAKDTKKKSSWFEEKYKKKG